MRVVLTGAGGFLGWHTRLRLHALTEHELLPIARDNWDDLAGAIASADAVIHLAGINRADDEALDAGNQALAKAVSEAIMAAGRPLRVVYANSTQVSRDTAYAHGKAEAGRLLARACAAVGSDYVDIRLPNLFGEHGRPHYNAFTATFIEHAIRGTTPEINRGAEVGLLHAQAAAQHLIDGLDGPTRVVEPETTRVHVDGVWDLLMEFKASYSHGEFPDLSTQFRVDLFNAYRSALFPAHYPLVLVPHSDPRGTFIETVRCRGGEGQSSISTTVPGVTRGEHYHLSKIERFAVVSGSARMSLRKMFTDEVIDFHVSADQPCAVDMPVGWVHNITNTGPDVLLTQFWSHELFRPDAPDTFAEPVRTEAGHHDSHPPDTLELN